MEHTAEALLPDTDAIKRNTLEWEPYKGKWLVRYKNSKGFVKRVITADWNEADQAFMTYLEEMRQEARKLS